MVLQSFDGISGLPLVCLVTVFNGFVVPCGKLGNLTRPFGCQLSLNADRWQTWLEKSKAAPTDASPAISNSAPSHRAGTRGLAQAAAMMSSSTGTVTGIPARRCSFVPAGCPEDNTALGQITSNLAEDFVISQKTAWKQAEIRDLDVGQAHSGWNFAYRPRNPGHLRPPAKACTGMGVWGTDGDEEYRMSNKEF